ncbi:MAG: methionine synthase, partial [Pseudomonadota bacterium]
MADLLTTLEDKVLLLDGAMGTQIQAADLSIKEDFWDKENCSEVLNLSRPDLVRAIHAGYLEAGADAVETNTFGGSPITLGEFELADQAFEINRVACVLAHEAIGAAGGDLPRFVIGAIGPGTRLPSLGHVSYADLEQAFTIQTAGLLAGGADAILCETCQDPLQLKAAINGARIAMREAGKPLPLMAQVTVETTGTMLVGTDIAAAQTIVEALDVPIMGLNCATGPQEMAEHLAQLSSGWKGTISVLPNAGLPELVDGKTVYPLGPEALAGWLERFITEDGVGIVGGCCGTTVEHIQALDAMLRRLADDGHRPSPKQRVVEPVPQLASLYSAVPLRQENAYLAIGERCNANGSKLFRERQAAEDWDACVAIGRDQVKEGSNALDVCTAYVGRDEVADMTAVVSGLRGAADAPLVFDSTELNVLEASLALYGGKGVLNSINFEDGEDPAAKRMELARKFGCAVIALTIDEEGMAKPAARKVEIARRLVDFACNQHGLAPHDLMIDPLTFTICTGNEDDRKLGLETLDAIEQLAAEFPDIQIILGLSNISFGLNPAARHVLNSVYLDHAIKRGLTGAIVHATKIMPLHKIAPEEVETALDLIYDRRRDGYDPLQAFMALFADRKTATTKKERPAEVEERLKHRIIDGDRQGLDVDLDEALTKHPPLDIINIHLLDGMKVVGELFGSGQMQLPFVLQSAETMKAAVAHLEPHMEKVEGSHKGTVVLATVKGDVHDIGKNIVGVVLQCNNFEVIDLGVMVPMTKIVDTARHENVDIIGLSGLITPSLDEMCTVAAELEREGFDLPLLIGGATTSRVHTAVKISPNYFGGQAIHVLDASRAVGVASNLLGSEKVTYIEDIRRDYEKVAEAHARGLAEKRRISLAEARADRFDVDWSGYTPPRPTFLGTRAFSDYPIAELVPYIDWTPFFASWEIVGTWPMLLDDPKVGEAARNLFSDAETMLKQMVEEKWLTANAVVGFFPANSEGDDIVIYEDDARGSEKTRLFTLRQQIARASGKRAHVALSDFVAPGGVEPGDYIGGFAVTAGIGEEAVAERFSRANDDYSKILSQALADRLAEAFAEHLHERVRREFWAYAPNETLSPEELIREAYRGIRPAPGYPAQPDHTEKRTLFDLLDAESATGVRLTENYAMWPASSVSGLYFAHPDSHYFGVGKIDRDQVA